MKHVVFFLIFTLIFMITSGCTGANHSTKTTSTQASSSEAGNGIVQGSIEPSVRISHKASEMTLHFSVQNQTEKPISLKFNTTQRFDYRITDSSGAEAYLYSMHRMFGQMVSSQLLRQGQSLDFSDPLPKLKPGHYSLTVWLTDQTYRPHQTLSFTVS